jgi:hypothetical protein
MATTALPQATHLHCGSLLLAMDNIQGVEERHHAGIRAPERDLHAE